MKATAQQYNSRLQFIDAEVTLDGKPAKISGAENSYATVSTLDNTASFKWSWAGVETICKRDGKFVS